MEDVSSGAHVAPLIELGPHEVHRVEWRAQRSQDVTVHVWAAFLPPDVVASASAEAPIETVRRAPVVALDDGGVTIQGIYIGDRRVIVGRHCLWQSLVPRQFLELGDVLAAAMRDDGPAGVEPGDVRLFRACAGPAAPGHATRVHAGMDVRVELENRGSLPRLVRVVGLWTARSVLPRNIAATFRRLRGDDDNGPLHILRARWPDGGWQRARWPDGGWGPTSAEVEVLVGIVEGCPVVCWSAEGLWKAKAYHQFWDVGVEASDPVSAVGRWIRSFGDVPRVGLPWIT